MTMSIDPSSMTKKESMLSRLKTKVAAAFSKPEQATANDISGPTGNASELQGDTHAVLPTNNRGIKPFAQSDARKAWARENYEKFRAQADVEPQQIAEKDGEAPSNVLPDVPLTNAVNPPSNVQTVNQWLPKGPANTQIAAPQHQALRRAIRPNSAGISGERKTRKTCGDRGEPGQRRARGAIRREPVPQAGKATANHHETALNLRQRSPRPTTR
jgi:hypothetical protein